MDFHVWNKNSDKNSWIMFISSKVFRKFYSWKFMHWRFTNNNSWMFIHKIWILFVQLLCQVHFTYFPIPHQQGNIAKLWSSNSLCEPPEWTTAWLISRLSYASGILEFVPKKSKCLNASPSSFPPRLVSLHYCFLTWWFFEAQEESFQNSNYPIN
jgi:hypothetical protein